MLQELMAGSSAGGRMELSRMRGEAARTDLLSVASRPLWNIWGDGLTSVEAHVHGPALSVWWEDEDDEDDASDAGYIVTPEGVAVIPIIGTLVDAETSWWMRYLGYVSIPQLARTITAAGMDGNVKNLLLHMATPGGHVSGLAAVCDAVWAIRQGDKRIWAACTQVCSAGYEIGSQCDRIIVSADGMAGCIGTVYLLSDWSGYYSEMGIKKFRITSTGAETFKGGGAMGTEITEAQQKDFKRLCDEYRTLFNAIVQRGRGFSDEQMGTLADGRVHIGANALVLNLVDAIATPESVLAALGSDDPEGALLDTSPQSPPDEDDDDEASDASLAPLFTQTLQENLTVKNTLGQPQNGSATQNVSALQFLNNLFTSAKNEADAQNGNAGNGTVQPAPVVPHPVLTAALAAGLDTPEKFTALVNEHKNLKDAQEKAAQQALTEARATATAAATTAFGAGSKELEEATGQIAVIASVGVLTSMTNAYKAATPKPLRGGAARQTQTTLQSARPEGEGAGTDDASNTLAKGLDPNHVYTTMNKQINGK